MSHIEPRVQVRTLYSGIVCQGTTTTSLRGFRRRGGQSCRRTVPAASSSSVVRGGLSCCTSSIVQLPSSGAVCRAIQAALHRWCNLGPLRRATVRCLRVCTMPAMRMSAPHVPCVLHVMKVVIRHNHANTVVLRLCSALARPQHLRSLHALREASSECHCVL